MLTLKSRKAAWIVLATVVVCTAGPVFFGNLLAKKGGLMDDCLLNRDDPCLLMDKSVEELQSKGLKTGDSVIFVLSFDGSAKLQDLQQLKSFTDEVKRRFPECGLLSLSIVPKYRDTGDAIANAPYVSQDLLTAEAKRGGMGLNQWKKEVARDPSVYGLLIGRNFDYAVVVLLLQRGFDEIGVFRRIADFLEERHVSWLEWFVKTDIKPTARYANVSLAGWAAGRGLMDAALTADILRLSAVGMCIVSVAFALSLLSMRQAVIATLIVVLGWIWTRGAIGLLELAGIGIYERVYVLLVYTSLIVTGISFVARKFEIYNEVHESLPGLPRWEAWRNAASANEMVIVSGVISIFNFATLYQIGVRGIMEVGMLSALGIFFLILLALWFLPAMHILCGGEAKNRAGAVGVLSRRWNSILDWFARMSYSAAGGKCDGSKSAKRGIILTSVLTLLAIALICADYVPGLTKSFKFLEVRTRPLEYVPGTIVYRAHQILNRPGNYGFDRLQFAVMPKTSKETVYEPRFLARVHELEQSVRKLQDVREVDSVMDVMEVIARESYKRALPTTVQEAYDSFQMIEWDLGPQVKEQLWCDNALVVYVSLAADDSNKVGEMEDRVAGVARTQFPDLDVKPFGKLAIYPAVDQYIREGKPMNVITSQWTVIAMCAAWIVWRNRRYRCGVFLSAWRVGLVMCLPFVFASAVIALLMVVLRVPLDQTTACVTALAVNAAIDFGLYLVADYHNALVGGSSLPECLSHALAEKGRLIVVDIALNALCFAPLILSSFIPVARLGWVMIVMLLACGYGCLVIMPPLLPWCVKRRKSQETSANLDIVATEG